MTQIPQASAGLRTCNRPIPFRNRRIWFRAGGILVSDNAV